MGGIRPLINHLQSESMNNVKCTKWFEPVVYMEVYTCVYELCRLRGQPNAPLLYQKHNSVFERYYEEVVLPDLQKYEADENFLEAMKKCFDNHNILNEWMWNFFQYLDRFHVPHTCSAPLRVIGQKLFKDHIYMQVKEKLTDAILEQIEKERNNGVIDHTLIKQSIKIYTEIEKGPSQLPGESFNTGGNLHGINDNHTLTPEEHYRFDFEQQLLQKTREYYGSKSTECISLEDTPTYLKGVADALEEEKKRRRAYISVDEGQYVPVLEETEQKLLDVVKEEMLIKHQDTIMLNETSGVVALLQKGCLDDLGLMYRLFNSISISSLGNRKNITGGSLLSSGPSISNSTSNGNFSSTSSSATTERGRHRKANANKDVDIKERFGLAPMVKIFRQYIEGKGNEILSDRSARVQDANNSNTKATTSTTSTSTSAKGKPVKKP